MDDEGWTVKGAPKKKAAPSPKASTGPLRTGESANRSASTPKKYTSPSPGGSSNRVKTPKSKPTFEFRNDETEYIYDGSKLTWTMPSEVFAKILAKYPGLSTLEYGDYSSRWSLMRQMENAHWYYTDDLISELPALGLKPVAAGDFFAALMQALVSSEAKLNPYYSPQRYTDEWQYWQKYCRVGGMAVVRMNEETKEYETLMVKNLNKWFSELCTTWPGGKAELGDTSFWQLAVREAKEEVGLDLSGDRSKVVAVLEGNRATQVVLVLPHDDSRLSELKKQDTEVHSIVWVPIASLDLATIKDPARETRPNDTGVILPKDDPKDLRMPWEVRELFKKLQSLSFDAPTAEGFDTLLDQDPCVSTVSHSQSHTPVASPAPSLRSSQC